MADQMKPTPRSPILGLFSDIVNLPLQYMSSPERTQQMQGTAQFLYGTGIPKTLERMSYGDSLFSGAGGLGGTTRMRPETAEALMNVAPLAPAAGRLASRAVKATEGLPVGMSIKDVGKSAITREGNPIQSAVVLVGDKIFMGRTHGDALNRAVYEGVVRKEGGKYIFPKGAEVNSDLFMTKDGQIIDRLQASKMFDIGASETAIEKGLMQNNPPKSMTVDSYIEQATALKKQREQSLYPQQAALDLAQQRAALPVSEGGLGLPANNTAMDRAKAIGFNKDVYHGAQNEITNIDFALAGQNTGNPNAKLGFFTTPNTEEASRYATLHGNKTNANIIPLVAKSENSYQMPYKELDDLAMAAYNLMMQSPDYNPNEVIKFGDMVAQKAAAERLKKYRDIASEKSLQRKNELMQEGFDSATVLQGKPMEEFIIFNPDSIRSRFAAFDPFRKDVATATAMGVALPDLLAQPVNQVQPTYETTPMYIDPFGNTIGSSIR